MTIGPNVGTAHIAVTPSLRGWASEVRRQLRRELRDVDQSGGSDDRTLTPSGARAAGRRAGDDYAGAFDRAVRSRVRRALTSLPPINLNSNSTEVQREILQLQFSLKRLSEQRVGIDISSADALAEVDRIQARLTQLGQSSPDIQVQADTALAAAELTAIRAQLADIDRSRARVRVDGDRGIFGWFSSLSGRTRLLLGLFAMLGPALLPLGAVLLSLGASFTAMFTAAATGVGVLLAAVLGNILPVIKAQQELEQKQDAATAAARTYAGAQRQVASAADGVADAQRNAARSIADAVRALADARRSAARQVAQAEDAVADAQESARDAQEALNDAREEARLRLAAYRDQLRGAALDEQGAMLSVQQAREQLDAVLADGSSTQLQIDQAQQALAEAEFAYQQSKKRNRDLKQEAKDARAAGVAGDDQVVEARERLTDANEALADAERSLGQARADAARQIADAERNLARAKADGAEAIADAQAQLAQAQEAAALAGADYAKAQSDLAETMSKFDGPARIFVEALDRAKQAWRDFTDATARPSFGLAARALDIFSAALPALVPLARRSSRAVRVLLDDLAAFGSGKEGQSFLRWLERRAPRAIIGFGRSIGNLLKGFGYLIGALAETDTGFLAMTRRFARWAKNIDQNTTLQRFVDYARRMRPVVGRFLSSLADAFVNVITAAGPIGTLVLEALTGVLDLIAAIDPDILQAVAAGFLAARVAMVLYTIAASAAFIASSGLAGVMAILGAVNPFVWVALAVAALVLLYKKVGWFRDGVDAAWSWIKKTTISLWENVLQPIFKAWVAYVRDVLIPVVKWLWAKVIKPVFGYIGNLIKDTWNGVIKPILKAWWSYLTQILIPALEWLWTKVVKPVFDKVGGHIRDTWQNIIKPVLTRLYEFVRDTVAPKLRSAFETIADIWNALAENAFKPIQFVVDVVWNKGLREVIGAIPGVDKPDEIKLPSLPKFRVGGPVTGGVRGKDSVLAWLMPGEHVLTASEVAAAGGHGPIYRMRELLAQGRGRELGDPRGIRKRLRNRGAGDLPAFRDGGEIDTTDATRAIKFAIDQAGKPYGWGAVGPAAYDCSGFMSALTNVLRGYYPHTRLGGTGTFPWSGFKPGVGLFTIGSSPKYPGSDVGHMAGTLAGLNVESRGGGVGVLLGSKARGYDDPGFSQVYHLGPAGDYTKLSGGLKGVSNNPLASVNKFAEAIKATVNFAKGIPSLLSKIAGMGPWGGMVRTGTRDILGRSRSWINEQIPGPGPFPAFDAGGLARRRGVLVKDTVRPERVLSPRQTELFERQIATLESFDAGVRRMEALTGAAALTRREMVLSRLYIEDWEKGLALAELMAVDAAEDVVARHAGHANAIDSMDYTG